MFVEPSRPCVVLVEPSSACVVFVEPDADDEGVRTEWTSSVIATGSDDDRSVDSPPSQSVRLRASALQ